VTLPLQSANLEVDIPWDWEQIQADAELIKNSETNILPDFDFADDVTKAQSYLFWSIQVLDVYSTYQGLKYDCVVEGNPLLGERPGLARMVTHKTVFLSPFWLLQSEGVFTKEDLYLYNTMGTVVIYNNYRVWDRARKVCKKR
tara:strand:+ start:4754 stop:5182 length:429 start_codon:yes stop_codon:yes gene_type:complete